MLTSTTGALAPGPGPSPDVPRSTARQATWWADRGARTKILSTVAVSALATAVAGVLGLHALSAAADSADRLHRHDMAGALAAADMNASLIDMRVTVRDALLASDP